MWRFGGDPGHATSGSPRRIALGQRMGHESRTGSISEAEGYNAKTPLGGVTKFPPNAVGGKQIGRAPRIKGIKRVALPEQPPTRSVAGSGIAALNHRCMNSSEHPVRGLIGIRCRNRSRASQVNNAKPQGIAGEMGPGVKHFKVQRIGCNGKRVVLREG